MPIMDMNDSTIYYELYGKGDPLVLIAGLMSDHASWLPVINGLAQRFRVLVFDNRGVGQTTDSGNPFTVETLAQDVMQLVTKLHLPLPHIVGHSLGGAIAQEMAHQFPEQLASIILCNTFLKPSNRARTIFAETLELYEHHATPVEIVDQVIPWAFSKTFLTKEVVEIIRNAAKANPHPQTLSGFNRQLQALANFDSTEWIGTLDVPALIIGSREDQLADLKEAQILHESIRDSQLAMIAGGHASLVEHPDLFIQHIERFIWER